MCIHQKQVLKFKFLMNPLDAKVSLRNFSLLHRIQTDSGAHPAFHHWLPAGGLFSGVKRLGCEANHLPPSSAEVKNAWRYTSTPQYVMVWCLVKHRDNFTLSHHAFHVSYWGIYEGVSKSFRTGRPGARTANSTALYH
jgi:hypothetical protein